MKKALHFNKKRMHLALESILEHTRRTEPKEKKEKLRTYIEDFEKYRILDDY